MFVIYLIGYMLSFFIYIYDFLCKNQRWKILQIHLFFIMYWYFQFDSYSYDFLFFIFFS
jgi:hypothetical protein